MAAAPPRAQAPSGALERARTNVLHHDVLDFCELVLDLAKGVGGRVVVKVRHAVGQRARKLGHGVGDGRLGARAVRRRELVAHVGEEEERDLRGGKEAGGSGGSAAARVERGSGGGVVVGGGGGSRSRSLTRRFCCSSARHRYVSPSSTM